ncbi:MAG: alpha/beta hydrolase, partial [Deltaproteobacteria bacterium]|nr:alpha/beta hydrolase [Deltaproteobacteria bacterium]
MKDISTIDYSALDQPEILMFLFHPRQEVGLYGNNSSAEDFLIPVENDVEIGARFHMSKKSFHNVLFFHGNGEIVADYDDLGPVYNKMRLNFLPVDYRGYGRSTGSPTVTAMMRDCHLIFDYVTNWLDTNGYSGPLIIMG